MPSQGPLWSQLRSSGNGCQATNERGIVSGRAGEGSGREAAGRRRGAEGWVQINTVGRAHAGEWASAMERAGVQVWEGSAASIRVRAGEGAKSRWWSEGVFFFFFESHLLLLGPATRASWTCAQCAPSWETACDHVPPPAWFIACHTPLYLDNRDRGRMWDGAPL